MNPYKKQVGGSHYKNMKIQPSKFINDNKLLNSQHLDERNNKGSRGPEVLWNQKAMAMI